MLAQKAEGKMAKETAEYLAKVAKEAGYTPEEGFEDLGKFIMGIFLLSASISSIISAIAFDLYHKSMNRIK